MGVTSRRLLFWTPRVLCIAFALFLSLFALDVFGQGLGFWKTLSALMIHLIPTFIVVALLAVAWRREWIGAVGFVGAGGLYAKIAWGHPDYILTISVPLFVLAVLFLANWLKHTELRRAA